MENAERFLNDISNWYVRRNRRRFWKSENDSDKLSAYHALYYVLIRYIKVMAPIVPFITEKIYNNLSKGLGGKAEQSIHHEYFPAVDRNLYNTEIISEIDVVKNIVSLGRSARNKANIKIRQPLSSLLIYSSKENTRYAIDNKYDILDELNVKDIEFVKKEKDLIDYNVNLNFKDLGKIYGDKMKLIANQISLIDKDTLISKLQSKKVLHLIDDANGLDVKLSKEDFILNIISPEGFSVSTGNDIVVGIKTHISDELKLEGLARDIIRSIQNLRKESGLEIEDRIHIGLKGLNEFPGLIDIHKDYIMNEVLGTKLSESIGKNDFVQSVKLDGIKIRIGISKTN